MATANQQFDYLLREFIAPMVIDMEFDDDDVGWQLLQTIPPKTGLGRDTKFGYGVPSGTTLPTSTEAGFFHDYRIRLQRAGIMEMSNFAGATIQAMGQDDTLFMGQANDDFHPDPTKATMRSYAGIRVALKMVKGNITLNDKQFEAELLTDPIEDLVFDYASDAVYQQRRGLTPMLWGDGGGAVARIGNNVAADLTIRENPTVNQAFFTVTEGTPTRFVQGQRYVLASHVALANFGSATRTPRAGALNTPGVFRCVGHDGNTRRVAFESEPGEGNIVATASDSILRAETFDFTAATVTAGSKCMQGFEALLIATGNYPGAFYRGAAMDVTKHPFLQAFITGDEAVLEDPTPEKIAELVDKAEDMGCPPPPVAIAERSLWTLYAQLERSAGAHYNVPQGATFQASGGVAGPMLSHQQHTFAKLNSSQIRPGMILGMDQSQFFKIAPMGAESVRWVFSSGMRAGTPSIFAPVMVGSRYAGTSQAPWTSYIEIGCSDPRRNFRRLGLRSQRTV